MEIRTKFSKGACTMRMAGEMNIYFVEEVKAELVDVMEKCDKLEINLSDVTEIDTAGIQLLILAEREMVSLGKMLCLKELSSTVLEVLALYNLPALFSSTATASLEEKS